MSTNMVDGGFIDSLNLHHVGKTPYGIKLMYHVDVLAMTRTCSVKENKNESLTKQNIFALRELFKECGGCKVM